MRRSPVHLVATVTAVLSLTGCPNEEVTQERDTDEGTGSTTGGRTTSGPSSAGPTTNGSSDSDASDSDPSDSDATTTSTTDASTTDETGSTTDATETGSTGPAGPDFACADGILMGDFPLIETGTIDAADGDDFNADTTCTDGSGGFDLAYQWTAPDAGTYIISTLGSNLDTVLVAYSECGGEQLACNDDLEAQSLITSVFQLVVEADETILIVVDAYEATDTGDFILTIEPMAT